MDFQPTKQVDYIAAANSFLKALSLGDEMEAQKIQNEMNKTKLDSSKFDLAKQKQISEIQNNLLNLNKDEEPAAPNVNPLAGAVTAQANNTAQANPAAQVNNTAVQGSMQPDQKVVTPLTQAPQEQVPQQMNKNALFDRDQAPQQMNKNALFDRTFGKVDKSKAGDMSLTAAESGEPKTVNALADVSGQTAPTQQAPIQQAPTEKPAQEYKPSDKEIKAQEKEAKRQTYLQQYAILDPDGMSKYMTAINAMEEQDVKRAYKKADTLLTHMEGVIGEDGKVDPAKFNQRAAQYGLPKIGEMLNGRIVTAEDMQSEIAQAKTVVLGNKAILEDKMKLDSELKKEKVKNEYTVQNKQIDHKNEMEKQEAKGKIDYKQADMTSGRSLEGTKISSGNSLLGTKISSGTTERIADKKIAQENKFYESGQKGNGAKVSPFDLKVYTESYDILNSPLSSPVQKAQAQAKITKLENKYGGNKNSVQLGNDTRPSLNSFQK